MTWFKVDDKFWSSPERLAASYAALGAWVTAGSYCADQLTDGIVSKNAQKMLGIRPKIARELVEIGLWLDHENGSFLFKNWSKYNPSKVQVEARRERLRDAGRAGGKRSGQSRRGELDESNSEPNAKHDASPKLSIVPSTNEASPVEHPSRPDPSTTSNEVVREPRKKRAATLPDGWMPDQAVIEAMRTECPAVDLEAEHRKFADYWLSKGERRVDWTATWRNWIRRASETRRPAAAERPVMPNGRQLTPAEMKFAHAEALKSNPNPEILRAAGLPVPPSAPQAQLFGSSRAITA
ncbi:hypothetical protein [Nocardia acidivorans]|uniref:hypothetical protein n=1 Tax=Nocardia acidivorans TaxID=404580 RepID=UPI000836BB93|nr:hypothetical protein [Nocardia acidivorans]